MNPISSLLFLITAFFLCGCYTKLANFQNPAQMGVAEGIDTLSDSTVTSAQVDTIIYKEKEVCVWERDFNGFPYLRCFPSYYPRNWFYYSNSPWWFRSSEYWYDYRRCPQYRYFDRGYGHSKYHNFHPHGSYWGGGHNHGGHGGHGGGSGTSTGAPNRSRSIEGVGNSAPRQSTLPKTSEQAKQNSQLVPTRPQRDRSTVLPQPNLIKPAVETENAVQKKTTPAPGSESAVHPVKRLLVPDSSGNNQGNRPKRSSRW